MIAAKTKLKNAEKVKRFLIEKEALNYNFNPLKEKEFIYFPLNKEIKHKNIEIADKKLNESLKTSRNLKTSLKGKLTEKEIEFLKTSFDSVGDIAILEIPKELEPREKIIAEELLKINKNVKTVLKKSGVHEGEFRTQKMQYLAGINTKETVYKENNVQLKLNVEEVYFSPRLSSERKRIAEQVKKNEEILVMFSGCAPYPCVLAKNTDAKSIIGIEINPVGHKYGLENIKLNKIKNTELICGDVKKVVPKLNKKFDRILMPLPKSAEDFLDEALTAAKKRTIIHFYDFLHENDIPKKAIEKIDKACKKRKIKYEVLQTVKCGQHAPRTYRICVDFRII